MTQNIFKSSTDKLAWQILDWGDMMRDADLSKDMSGPESPPELHRSWCVEGNISRYAVYDTLVKYQEKHIFSQDSVSKTSILHTGQYSVSEEPLLSANTPYLKNQYSVFEEPILSIGQYFVSEDPIHCTVFMKASYRFDYPMRRLTMEEMLAKFIDEVTTRGGKMTSEATHSKEINETRINKNEQPRFEQDMQEKLHDDGEKNKSSSIRERTTQPLVKPQQSSISFPNRVRKEKEEALQ
ncbi:hypothetical protein Tco_1392756 [Tanacetum coccineum]